MSKKLLIIIIAVLVVASVVTSMIVGIANPADKGEQTTEPSGVTIEKTEDTTEKAAVTTEKVEVTTEKVKETTEKVEETTEKVEETTEKVEETTEKVEETEEEITEEANEGKNPVYYPPLPPSDDNEDETSGSGSSDSIIPPFVPDWKEEVESESETESELPEMPEDAVEVEDIDTLREAVNNGENVRLAADIVFDGDPLVIPAGVNVALDLNGCILKNGERAIQIEYGASLSLYDSSENGGGEIVSNNTGVYVQGEFFMYGGQITLAQYAIALSGGAYLYDGVVSGFQCVTIQDENAYLIIEGGLFDGGGCSVYAYQGEVEIRGGAHHGGIAPIAFLDGRVTITGGDFYATSDGQMFLNNGSGDNNKICIRGGRYDTDVSAWIDETYTLQLGDDGWYAAVPAPTVTEAEELLEKIANGESVLLGADIDLSESGIAVPENANVVINLNGYTLTVGTVDENYLNPSVYIPMGASLNLKSKSEGGMIKALGDIAVLVEGTLVTRDVDIYLDGIYGIMIQCSGSARIDSGRIYGNQSIIVGDNLCTVTINGGSFTSDPTAYIDTNKYEIVEEEINGEKFYTVKEFFVSFSGMTVISEYETDPSGTIKIQISEDEPIVIKLHGTHLEKLFDSSYSFDGGVVVNGKIYDVGGIGTVTFKDNETLIWTITVQDFEGAAISYGYQRFGVTNDCTTYAAYVDCYVENEELASVEITDSNQLGEALNAGGEIKLGADIDYGNYALYFDSDVNAILDLNGYTLSNICIVVNNGELTIIDSYQGDDREGQMIANGFLIWLDGGVCNITDGLFCSENDSVIFTEAGELNISGGKFVSRSYNTLRISNGTVNVSGGIFEVEAENRVNFGVVNGTVSVSGGRFDRDPSDYLAEACEVVVNGDGRYTVEKYALVTDAKALEDALLAGGKVVLGADIDFGNEIINYNKNVIATLDLNGYTLSNIAIGVNSGTLTVFDSYDGNDRRGMIKSTSSIFSVHVGVLNIESGVYEVSADSNSVIAISEGEVYISGGEFRSKGDTLYISGGVATVSGGSFSAGSVIADIIEGELNISGGEFECEYVALVYEGGKLNISGGRLTTAKYCFAVYGGEVTVSNGEITSLSDNQMLLFMTDGIVDISGGRFASAGRKEFAIDGGDLKISGGTFDFDPSSYLVQGALATDNGDGSFTVRIPTTVTSKEELDAALDIGGYIKLGADIHYDASCYFDTSVDTFIDLNGYTLSAMGLEITSGRITIIDSYGGSDRQGKMISHATTVVVAGGVCNIRGGVIEASTATNPILVCGGVLNVSGGELKTVGEYLLLLDGGEINVSGGSFMHGDAVENIFCVLDGTVKVSGGIFSAEPDEYLAGNAIIKNNGNGSFEVIMPVMVTSADELDTALNAGGCVMLGANVDCGDSRLYYDAGVTATLDLNGYTLSNISLRVQAGELTITDSYAGTDRQGKLTGAGETLAVDGGICNIEDGVIEATGENQYLIFLADGELNISGGDLRSEYKEGGLIYTSGGILNISGGEFSAYSVCVFLTNGEMNVSGGKFETSGQNGIVIQAGDGVADITGGEFSSRGTYGMVLYLGGAEINIKGGRFTTDAVDLETVYVYSGTLNISGGSFDCDPSQYVDTAKCTVSESEGIYTVSENTMKT